MTHPLRVTAIAVVADVPPRPRSRIHRARAVAVMKTEFIDDGFIFSLATHVVRSPEQLQHWLDEQIADDPLLVGHRLIRMSRLLRNTGYDRHLAGTFCREGRYDIAGRYTKIPMPLSRAAAGVDILAIDDFALSGRAALRLPAHVAADIALTNSVASFVVWASHAASVPDTSLDVMLTRLGAALRKGRAPATLVAAITPLMH